MDIHVVHGNKSSENGGITEEFKDRIAKAVRYLKSSDVLVITGGVTREEHDSEAVLGLEYLHRHYVTEAKVLLEKQSVTTGENIKFTRGLVEKELSNKPDRVFIYHRSSSIWKTKILYKRLWPGTTRLFVPCYDPSDWLYKILENTVIIALALIDPHEKSFVWKLFKRTKRNFKK